VGEMAMLVSVGFWKNPRQLTARASKASAARAPVRRSLLFFGGMKLGDVKFGDVELVDIEFIGRESRDIEFKLPRSIQEATAELCRFRKL
jgi:hypothetical protein